MLKHFLENFPTHFPAIPIAQASPAAEAPAPGIAPMLIWLGLMFAGLWFLIIAPQRKMKNQRNTMLRNLKVGDKVLTKGGLIATIDKIKSEQLSITLGPDVKVTLHKGGVEEVIPKKTD